ncbi:carbohydrate porin [Salinivibrio sp. IB282]|uniref:carbohydrate porin n=1 Tax=Salinivibrio sp. IB282 TaxID=1766122 RepID=UPI0009888352|nr:carbohydrate porin [Salinivibrio sp. IB282]OOE63831.1 maltoporin [Salinivibrio sp. IB282]
MRKVSLIAAAVATAVTATSAFAVDFNGYMRAGTGISASNYDGSDTGDLAINKHGIGRLGNENDNYSEFGFSEELKTGEQTWRVESMIASGAPGESGWEDGDFNVAQFAVKAKGVLADEDATLWAGKTYYQRKDIHITDFYFLNTSGTGGGIENLSVGDQKLSLALIQDNGSQKVADGDKAVLDQENTFEFDGGPAQSLEDHLADCDDDDIACKTNVTEAAKVAPGAYKNVPKEKSEDVNGYIADIRLADIDLWSDAKLELAAAYNFGVEKADQDLKADDGLLVTGIVHQGMDNGFNQTILQYGTNGYGVQAANFWGAGTYYDRSGAQNEATGYRLINWGVMNLGESWEMGHQFALLKGNDIGGKDKDGNYTGENLDIDQFSVVVRPMYKWNNTMRSVFEAGYNAGEKINDDGNAVEDFGNSKLTVAQAWAMGDSFWARPEIRVYGSYISDLENDDAFGSGEDSELVAGVQVEAWW